MSGEGKASPPFIAATRLRSAWVWRLAHAMLPLGQRFNPLMAQFMKTDGYLSVPWQSRWLTISAAWLHEKSSASGPIYRAPRRQNPEFFRLVAPHLARRQHGLIVDVGANIGVYTMDMRSLTDAPIIAFEPDPLTFALLQVNVTANQLRDVTVRNVACGDRNGTLAFDSGINGSVSGAAHAAAIAVPVERLDDALRARGAIDLIKIDCEGYEWHVLDGCRAILAAWRPILFVELHPKLIALYGHSLTEVFDLLRPHYRMDVWDLNPAQRKRSRLRRFLSRYRDILVRAKDEAAALELAGREPRPDQLFLLALPRESGLQAAA